MRAESKSFILLLILALVALSPAAAQEALPGVFSEVIEVRVVNIEVVVTDRAGDRVSGLTADDFRLLVDGEEVPVAYFTEVRGGEAVEPGGEKKEQKVPRSLPTLEPGRPVPTSYLVFIDELFTINRDRDQVLKRLVEELAFLGPDDRMAVVAFDGQNLEMLSTWSQSQAQLRRALQEAMQRPSQGLMRLSELRLLDAQRLGMPSVRPGLTSDPDPAIPGMVIGELTIDETAYSKRLEDYVRRAVAGATATLRSFARPPGRKVMLILSGGWPISPQEYAIQTTTVPLIDRGSGAYALYRSLSDTANLLGYTLYPIDIPGRRLDYLPTAERRVLRQTDPLQPALEPVDQEAVPGTDDPLVETDAGSLTLREFQEHNSLLFLARQTGGRALIDSGRLMPLETVVSDTRSYYWLGFTPSWKGDDARHDIRVDVRRAGLKARSRENFLDFSRRREVNMMVESALLFGNPPSARPLPVKVGQPRRAGLGKMTVPLTLAIPMEAVTMLEQPKRWVGQVELRVAALDERGNTSEIPVVPIVLEGDGEPPPGSYSRYDTTLKLRREKQRLVLSIYDPASGGMLATTVDITP